MNSNGQNELVWRVYSTYSELNHERTWFPLFEMPSPRTTTPKAHVSLASHKQ